MIWRSGTEASEVAEEAQVSIVVEAGAKCGRQVKLSASGWVRVRAKLSAGAK